MRRAFQISPTFFLVDVKSPLAHLSSIQEANTGNALSEVIALRNKCFRSGHCCQAWGSLQGYLLISRLFNAFNFYMQLSIIYFKARVEIIMWKLWHCVIFSNLDEMSSISRMVFSLAYILLSYVHKQCWTQTWKCSQKCEEGHNGIFTTGGLRRPFSAIRIWRR